MMRMSSSVSALRRRFPMPDYSWSTDEEYYFGAFSSVDEAVMDAIVENELVPGDSVSVGENVPYAYAAEEIVRSCFDAAAVIEMLSEHAYDNFGEDWPSVRKEDEAKIEEALVQAILPFIDEPSFWSIKSARDVAITFKMFVEAHLPSGTPHCRRCFDFMLETDENSRICAEGGTCKAITEADRS